MITEKILKELGFKRHPSLKIPEYWNLWLSTNTYNVKKSINLIGFFIFI